jgi:cytochrome P450
MPLLSNLFLLPLRYLGAFAAGLGDLARLLYLLAKADKGTPVVERLEAMTATTDGQRLLFGVLRVFNSNLSMSRRLVEAYANAGTVIVTRFDDVREVLERDEDFAVVYGPRIGRLTAGSSTFAGMQPGQAREQGLAMMHLALRLDDVERLLLPAIEQGARAAVAASGRQIDVPAQLTLPVMADVLARYFGLPGSDGEPWIGWTTPMYRYLALDLAADPDVEREALAAARAMRAQLDAAIAARKAAPGERDDVLNRCLALQKAAQPNFDDAAIRDNWLLLVVSALPTVSAAAVNALDELLRRPRMLEAACDAARGNDLPALGRYLFEALRFRPVHTVICRRAVRDCVIAQGSLRARKIPQDSMVFAATFGAMFDPLTLWLPRTFRTDRPSTHYLHWGYGAHRCFGEHINRVAVPALLRPLLASRRLSRVDAPDQVLDRRGGVLPIRFAVATGRR